MFPGHVTILSALATIGYGAQRRNYEAGKEESGLQSPREVTVLDDIQCLWNTVSFR